MAKAKKKKVNPRRIPASKADVSRAKDRATHDSIILCKALVFQALLDEGVLAPENVKRGWERTQYLADSMTKKRCTLRDLYTALDEEYTLGEVLNISEANKSKSVR